MIELGLDPVEMDLDLGVKAARERLFLPVGRRVAGIAVDQRRQGRRVDAARKKRGWLGRRQVNAVRDVAMAVGEVIFAIDDDRAVDDLTQQQGRSAPAAVGDDQVGAQARLGTHRVVNGPALLEVVSVNLGPGNAVARAMLGRQGHLVQLERLEHLARRGRAARKTLHQEAAPPAVALGQLEAKPAELGGESVVDEQDVHGLSLLAATSAVNRSASRGRQTSWE